MTFRALDLSRLPGWQRRTITRAGTGRKLETYAYGYEYLCTELRRKIHASLSTNSKATSKIELKDLDRHAGEEFIFVISGQITFHSEQYEPVKLSAGDCIYFDSDMGHATASVGDEEAFILDVCGFGVPILSGVVETSE